MPEIRGAWPTQVTLKAAEAADDDGEEVKEPSRILAGVAVPFGEIGFTSAGPTRFEPGSLGEATGSPAFRLHDIQAVIGVVSASYVTDDGVVAEVKVSKTAAGDETLVLAADGALGGFSGGWSLDKYRFEADDDLGEVLVVEAATWQELSIIPTKFQAFPGALIDQVAASRAELKSALPTPQPSKEASVPDPVTPVVEAVEAEPITPTLDVSALGEAIAAGLKPSLDTITAALERPQAVQPEPTIKVREHMTAGKWLSHYVWAQNGSQDSRDLLATLDLVTTTEAPGYVPPAYTNEILQLIDVTSPAVENMVRHQPLPESGMVITKPRWDTKPTSSGWYTTEGNEPASDAVAVGTYNTSVLSWAHANRVSLNLMERSAFGGFADGLFQQYAILFASQLEAKVSQVIEAAVNAASNVTTAESTILATIGKLVGLVIEQQRNSSGAFVGLRPDFVAVGSGAWGDLFAVTTQSAPGFANGSIDLSNFSATLAGLQVYLVPSMDDDDVIVGSSQATVMYDGTPDPENLAYGRIGQLLKLRSLVVNTMSVELGAYANVAIDVEFPDAIAFANNGS